MARPQFYDYHNMVAILEKSEHNVDFYPIVDFVEASPLSSLPDVKIFENLTLMGYNISLNQKFTFQKGQFFHQWKYLIHTIMQCLSPKIIGFNEFSSNIATALVCLATNRTYNFSKMIFDGLVKNVNNKGEGSGTPTKPYHTPSPEAQQTLHTTHSSPTHPPVTTASIPTATPSETTPIRQYTRRAWIAQSSALLPVADEPVYPLRDVSEGEACPTESVLGADQDRATIAKTSTLPHDSAPKELEINRLKARVKLLEDRDGVDAERSRDDAPIKGMNLDEGEAVAERVSNDTEEMATVLTSMETATVLASGVAEVPIGSGYIPTASSPATKDPTGSDVVPTASPIFATTTVVTPYTRRKGKETFVESKTLKKKKIQEQIDIQMARQLKEEMERDAQRMNEQIARDAEIARIHVEEELQSMINGLDMSNETSQQRKSWSKKQKRDYYMAVIKSNLGWKVKDFRGMTFKEIEAKFTTVWKQLKDFIPIGSKEEAERFKRNGIRFEQESAKKLKTSEEVPEEAKSPDEVPKEKVKEMMQLVPIEEITRLGGSSASYQFFIDLLKHLDREDLNQLWALVKESLSNRQPTSDKEMELWVELKRLYEPDDEDQLKFHACGEGLPSEEGSGNCNDLILKIYKIANCPRRIIGIKMHMAFPLPVIEFPLAEEVPTASEESSHCPKKRDATAKRIALLSKSQGITIDAQVAREMEEDFARENQRLSEQLVRDLEISRLHVEEELKMIIEGEKIELISELVKYQDHRTNIPKYQAQQKQLKEKFTPVKKQFEDFVPMNSKEESERVKRQGLKIDQGSSKRMKTSKDESKEELKEMMQLVPLEEVYVEALQLWTLVKETFSRQATKDKEKELWVELKRLFKPDFEDQLWTYNQAFMHDPLDWNLYDTCGVHHVFTKD
nr:synaptobrevin, longin-like domain protein [Tanacetum cinerariifolium]